MRKLPKRGWLKSVWKTHRKRILIGVPLGLIAISVLVQLLYPSGRFVPFQTVDSLAVGGWKKQDAAWELRQQALQREVKVFFGKQDEAQHTPVVSELGITPSYESVVNEVRYPWYLRLVPTSLLWMHAIGEDAPKVIYERDETVLAEYIEAELDGACQVAPVNATAEATNETVRVIAAKNGGVCKAEEVSQALKTVQPVLAKQARVEVSVEEVPAKLQAGDIEPIVAKLNQQLAADIKITYEGGELAVAPREVRSWLQFSTENDTFEIIFAENAAAFLNENLGETLQVAPGVSRVTTKDFIETSRQDGAPGRTLAVDTTLEAVKAYLLAEADNVPAVTNTVAPKVEYTREYSKSDEGISALMKHFAEDNDGVFGVALQELSGERRRASYQGDRKFTTASTYKLYVAYSTLKRVESGELNWNQQIAGGRNLEKCFDDMIVKSDNPCAEALVAKIGYRPLTVDAQSIVSQHTTFLDTESYKTTASDLSTFMASLATGQISLQKASQDRLIHALKRNEYRQGIPAGANGQVADKVGFLNAFLHDAAIVYSPSGTYALSIMTEGSSWSKIAELTREIEKLR